MKAITNIRLTARKLATRLHSAAPTRADKQRGASALEYIVLAAAIIFIVGILATNTTVQTTLETAFNNLFTDAEGVAGGADGGTGGGT